MTKTTRKPATRKTHWLIEPSADQPGIKLSDKFYAAALAKADASKKPAKRKPSKRAIMISMRLVIMTTAASSHERRCAR